MGSRPSEPLLKILRETAQKKGLNTAALATAAGIDRAHLKHVLSGREPLTVDELIALGQALQIQAADLGIADIPGAEEGESAPEPVGFPNRADSGPDPYGNHAEQALKLGFALGCDLFFSMRTDKLQGSGVPITVLERYKPNLPIKLDAAYHRHNDPQFFPEGLRLKLSFDAIYTCLFPWDAFQQITFFPLPPSEPPEEEQVPKEEPRPRKGGHLRLVE